VGGVAAGGVADDVLASEAGPADGPTRSRRLGSPRTRRTTRRAASTTSRTLAHPVNHTVIVP